MKISESTNYELTKLSKERKTALIAEMKKLISLSAACEYYLAALCERTDITVSFEKFNPKELSKWSREWASQERFKKAGLLQQILYSGLGLIFKANDPLIKNLPYCYIDVAQKLMFYSGEFENSRDYLRAFTDCCRDEIEGSINIESFRNHNRARDQDADFETTLSIDNCIFTVSVKKSYRESETLIYSIKSQVPDESHPRSALTTLTMPYLKDIIGLFSCALWINMTGEQAFNFVEVPIIRFMAQNTVSSMSAT